MYKKLTLIIVVITVIFSISFIYKSNEILKKNNKIPLDFKEDIEKLKSYRKEAAERRYESSRINLTAVGDIMLARGVGNRLPDNGTDSVHRDFKLIFDNSDILFGNLECPISNRGRRLPGKGICFRARPETVKVLTEGGFDIVSLANNHILDYDSEALTDTIEILKEAGIAHVGAGENINEARKPHIINVKGRSIGFLAYNEFAPLYFSYSYKRRFVATEDTSGTTPLDINMIIEDVRAIRDNVDIIAVSLHWGIEESNKITPGQREFAHMLIDNGVDIILGHHPHVIQPIEIYKSRPIIYSMGNYIFDQRDENNKQAMAVNILMHHGKIREIQAFPIYIVDRYRPILAQESKGDFIKRKILNLSGMLNTKGKISGNKVIFDVK